MRRTRWSGASRSAAGTGTGMGRASRAGEDPVSGQARPSSARMSPNRTLERYPPPPAVTENTPRAISIEVEMLDSVEVDMSVRRRYAGRPRGRVGAPAVAGSERSAAGVGPAAVAAAARGARAERERAGVGDRVRGAGAAVRRAGPAAAGHAAPGAGDRAQLARGLRPGGEVRAQDALRTLPAGSDRWFSAVGELAAACSQLGHHERLTALAEDLRAVIEVGVVRGPHVVASCRLANELLRVGWPELAEGTLSLANSMQPQTESPAVMAWTLKVRATQALHAGDPGAHLELTQRQQPASRRRATRATRACSARRWAGPSWSSAPTPRRARRWRRPLSGGADEAHGGARGRLQMARAISRLGEHVPSRSASAQALEPCMAREDRREKRARGSTSRRSWGRRRGRGEPCLRRGARWRAR